MKKAAATAVHGGAVLGTRVLGENHDRNRLYEWAVLELSHQRLAVGLLVQNDGVRGGVGPNGRSSVRNVSAARGARRGSDMNVDATRAQN
jgi:hypothetical protein